MNGMLRIRKEHGFNVFPVKISVNGRNLLSLEWWKKGALFYIVFSRKQVL